MAQKLMPLPKTSIVPGHFSTRVRVDAAGRIVIPAVLRERLGIVTGQELLLSEEPAGLTLRTFSAAVAHAQAALRRFRTDKSIVDELIADRRAEAESEDRE